MYSTLYEDISSKLCTAYAKEEEATKQIVQKTIEEKRFNPCEYGQISQLASCTFPESAAILNKIDSCITPFEIVDALKEVHKVIQEELKRFAKKVGLKEVEINADTLLPSLLVTFLGAKLEHPIKDMMHVRYFRYIEIKNSGFGN